MEFVKTNQRKLPHSGTRWSKSGQDFRKWPSCFCSLSIKDKCMVRFFSCFLTLTWKFFGNSHSRCEIVSSTSTRRIEILMAAVALPIRSYSSELIADRGLWNSFLTSETYDLTRTTWTSSLVSSVGLADRGRQNCHEQGMSVEAEQHWYRELAQILLLGQRNSTFHFGQSFQWANRNNFANCPARALAKNFTEVWRLTK